MEAVAPAHAKLLQRLRVMLSEGIESSFPEQAKEIKALSEPFEFCVLKVGSEDLMDHLFGQLPEDWVQVQPQGQYLKVTVRVRCISTVSAAASLRTPLPPSS